MIVFAFLLALGLVTLAVLAVAGISLAKEGARLASSIAAFEREVRPVLEDIRKGAEQTSERLEGLRPGGDGDGDAPPARGPRR